MYVLSVNPDLSSSIRPIHTVRVHARSSLPSLPPLLGLFLTHRSASQRDSERLELVNALHSIQCNNLYLERVNIVRPEEFAGLNEIEQFRNILTTELLRRATSLAQAGAHVSTHENAVSL